MQKIWKLFFWASRRWLADGKRSRFSRSFTSLWVSLIDRESIDSFMEGREFARRPAESEEVRICFSSQKTLLQ